MEPEISSIAIQELFDALRVEFDPVAREAGLRLSFVPTSLWVRSDRQLLRRILQNLIANAIKYTPSGGVLIGVRRRDGEAMIEVLDTGLGIPEEKQELIFQEFLRLDPRANQARGLGLGLSIVERISRILGHPIHVHSEVGRGSRFSITAPLSPAAQVIALPPESFVSPAPLGTALVVCIDNEPDVLAGMRTMLIGWGCSVIAAASADEAIAALEAHRKTGAGDTLHPTIIVADYHLDDGIGTDAIAAIRAHEKTNIPGVILTADHSPEVQRQLRELEFTLLRKPLKAAALRATIMQSMRRMAAE